MRVLLLTQYFAPEVGAAQARLVYLARYLRQQGHEVVIVAAPPSYPQNRLYPGYVNGLTQSEEWEGSRVFRTWVYLPKRHGILPRLCNFLSFPLSSLLALRLVGKVDVIFVETPPIFLAFSAWIYGAVKQAPVVIQYSDLWVKAAIDFGYIPPGRAARFALWLETQALRRGRKVIAATQGLAEDLRARGLEGDRIILITNGVDCDHYRPGPASPNLRTDLGLKDKFVVMFAGTLSLQSGLDVVLDTADLLRDDRDIVFVMVGDGTARGSMERAAVERQLPNILFLGHQAESDLPEYLRMADVGLNTLSADPVTQHTLSVKLFAYMACGLPVICTDRREVHNLIVNAQAGVLVPPNDPGAIARAVARLKGDRLERLKLGRSGREFVVEKFHRRDKAEEVHRVLIQACESGRSGLKHGRVSECIAEDPTLGSPR